MNRSIPILRPSKWSKYLSPLMTSVSQKFTIKMSCQTSSSAPPQTITTLDDSRRFMVDCFKAVGCNQKNAGIVADNLLGADYRGHYSHGMNRLGLYTKSIKNKIIDPNAVPTIEKKTAATAVVNGNNGLGAVIGKFCMDLAMEFAKKEGVGMVVCHHSNHYGFAGLYGIQAIDKGLIGFTCSNTSPFMVPTGAKDAALGTNPICLGAPGKDGDSFVLDMATTTVAVGKIEMARKKDDVIPEGWALNEDGKVETNATKAAKASRLLPLGGLESGYKGYGLAMLVEIFCGILSGSAYGPNIRSYGQDEVANLGQCFIAIDPEAFTPGATERMSDLMNSIRNMEPADPTQPVFVHGDPERKHMEKVQRDGGLLYLPKQHETNRELAKQLNVCEMQFT